MAGTLNGRRLLAVFEAMSSIEAVIFGAALGAVIVLPFVFRARARSKDAEVEQRRAEMFSARTRGILSASPDGIFMWDNVTGGITCSGKLADMLSLEAGTLARYDDIRARFTGEDLQNLEQGVSLLRAKGTPFAALLRLGQQILQVMGNRAVDAHGEPLADIVWMRDVSNVISGTSGAARNASGMEDRHLTALLDTLPIPIWLRDANLELAFQNRAAEREDVSEPALAMRARNDRQSVQAQVEIGADETKRTLLISETPLAPQKGDEGGTIGFAIDLLDQPTATEVAQTTTAPSPAQMLQPLSIGVAVFDGDTTLVAANSAFADLWRIEASFLESKPSMGDLLVKMRELRRLPEVTDFGEFRRHELSHFGGLDRIIEDELHLPDERTIRRRFGPLDMGGLVMTCEDVSGNLDLQRSLTSLDRVQKTTMENLREGVAVFGADGRLQLINPQMLDLWDLSEADLAEGKRLTDVVETLGMRMAANTEAWPSRKERIATAVMSRTLSTGRFDLINGNVLAFANVPLPDGATLVSYSDITASFRVEEALRERARTLAEADRMKTEFIANVALEVSSPLNTINGFADMLRQEMFGELNDRQMEYANSIHETSNHMIGVVTDILDLAVIEAGRMEINKDTIDPHAVLVDAFNIVKEQAKRKTIRIDFDCAPDIGYITADAKRLTQVVFNLLTNAITFTPKLGHITLSAKRDDDWLEISVSDSGPGIPKADRARMLEPFRRLNDDDHRSDGPGLGLTIVKRFIDLHSGTVEIRSNKSRGTSVICRIPIEDGDREGVAPEDTDHAIVSGRAAE